MSVSPLTHHAQGHKHGKKAAAGSEEEDCCGEDNCTHGSGADAQQSNPVAAMPGLVFEPKVAKTVVAFMKADTPDKVSQAGVGRAGGVRASAALPGSLGGIAAAQPSDGKCLDCSSSPYQQLRMAACQVT